MTGGILYKIMLDNFCVYVRTPNVCYSRWPSYAVRRLRHDGVLVLVCSRRYGNALRAVIESALVTWIGILIYEITSLAPKGHITVCTMRFEL
jgi:hypothetical protein